MTQLYKVFLKKNPNSETVLAYSTRLFNSMFCDKHIGSLKQNPF